MKRFIQYGLIFLLSLVVIRGYGSHTAIENTIENKLAAKKENSHHGELKLVQGTIHTAAAHSFQKSGHPGFYTSLLSMRSLVRNNGVNNSAYRFPLVKDYLFFIYPSHHFW